jgi:Family of unknown function (DUF6368)
MAGPTVTILLPDPLGPLQAETLGQIIHAVSDTVCGDDFSVTSTIAIGGSGSFEGRPFVCTIGVHGQTLSFDYSDDELEQIHAIFGIRPTCAITFAAMCNQHIDHEIAGRLAHTIAIKLDGFIDLNGRIELDVNDHDGLHQIRYTHSLYAEVIRHCCTPDSLARYMTFKHFRMVK